MRALLLAASIFAASTPLAGLAHADDGSFVNDMRNVGVTTPDAPLIALGHQLCDAMQAPGGGVGGLSPGNLGRWQASAAADQLGFTPRQKHELRIAASDNLCPGAW